MRTARIAAIGILVTLALWGLSRSGLFEGLERSALDLRFRLNPTTGETDGRIVLVLLDGGSMDQLPWPVPRQLYADVLDLLQEWGAEVVAFDILFDLPSVYSAAEDSIFGSIASRSNTVFVMALLQREGDMIPGNALIQLESSQGQMDSAWFCTPPMEMIARGASLLASTSDRQDPDGVFRSVRLLTATPEGISPSLPLATAWLALGMPGVEYSGDHLTIGDINLQTTGACRLQLEFHGPEGTYESIPLADLTASLNARAMGQPCPIDPSIFDGAIVLVGYAAPSLYDLKPTPYSPKCPGVEVLATAVDNILNGDSIVRYPEWVPLVIALFVSMLSALFLSSVDRIPVGTVLAILPTVVLVASSILLFRSGIWLETVWPSISGIITILAGGIFLFSSETRRKHEIRSAFSQYLSPDVVAQVTENPETLVLGGDKRFMTAFFSDIRGFTGFSEKLSPEVLVSLLNRYLTTMTDIIMDTGGTVDKFEGDAIIAFWGAPIYHQDHAARACSAALRCQEAHSGMNREFVSDGYPELFTRMGLSTGDMVVGNMGSSNRFDYTVIGSTVNLGSRLEGANKVYGTAIMVQDETAKQASDRFVFRELDTIRVVGQKQPVTVHELICRIEDLTPDVQNVLEAYASALELYRLGNFTTASTMFSRIGDAPSGIMEERCGLLVKKYGDGSAEWDGIFNLEFK